MEVFLRKIVEKLNNFLCALCKNSLTPYLIIVGFFCVAVASRILFNGMVFEFDYGMFQPDGIHYTIRTLMFLGETDISAASKVSSWYLEHGTKVRVLNPVDFIPENNPAWPVIAPRILYPILSAPFVYLIGIPGMLVIPSLSLLLTMLAIYYQAKKLNAPWIGLALALSISISPTVLRWAVSNCTDSLLMGIFALAMVLLLEIRDSTKYLTLLATTVVLSCLTRFSLPIWLILALLFFRPNRKVSLVIGVTSILFTAPTLAYRSESGKIPASDNFSSVQEFVLFPITFLKIMFIEFAQLAALDRILLIVILSAFISSVLNFDTRSSQMFLVVFIAVFTLGAINGVLGVNFRYQLPLIPFAAAAIITLVVSKKQKVVLNG